MRLLDSPFTLFLLAAVLLPGALAAGDHPVPPTTRKVDQKDNLHGVEVADPYRWLEQDVREAPEVASWVEAQNRVTFGYLEKLPQRTAIRRRLAELWDFARVSTPVKRGGRYFFSRNDGLQNQSVLFVQESLAEPPRLLLDPNSWSKDGTVALVGFAPSRDGRFLAYGVAEAGSDWTTFRVLDVDSGAPLADEVRWTKFSDAAWAGDGSGFFYSRYPEPKPGAAFQSLNTQMTVCFHRLGSSQSEDVVVFERPDHPDWGFGNTVTEDGRYLVITTWIGTDARHAIFVRDLAEPLSGAVELVSGFEHEYTLVGSDGPTLYFKTDLDAPRGRLIAIDLRHPARELWREILPQQTATLASVDDLGRMFVATFLEDAASRVRCYARDGKLLRELTLDGIGSVGGFSGRSDDTETFFTFTSFTTPATVYRLDLATGEKRVFFAPKVAFDPTAFVVRQVFVPSKDGTRVPVFLVHRKGLKLDGSNPTLLYGYGGFNVSLTPYFSVPTAVWLEMGGVYAQANLRGGGEYGEPWHRAGTKLQKQNVFDDFIAAAEWLVANRVTRRDKLAISGASNGGLLVGAAMTQRPELFGAALPAVGVMDMLRFHRFTAGRFWVDDYGSAEDPAEFKALYAYSPYHNLRRGTAYPATLVTTADTDDRVVPGHSFKFAAALQEAQAGPAPVLIRIETRAGHGGGKPVAKQIEESADEWSFLAANLGITLPPSFASPAAKR
ncbi:MAG: S9 family peptidase [Holophagales bacterium]|nr:MAG: S9 family peptidase [Holophagales bacterium]